ncbi:MAG TPA: hypothetical protein VI160_02565 [Gemmatimonadales bacterium]
MKAAPLLVTLAAAGCRPAPKPADTTHVPSAAAAGICDTVALGWRATGRAEVRRTADTSVAVQSDSVPRHGCAVHATAAQGVDSVQALGLIWNSEAPPPGWTDLTRFDADGPDGWSRTYERAGLRCQIEFSQDGGDDSDSTYVPSPAVSEATFCWAT